ncbi:MAG: TerD family protein [Culicoidibacterales bacterium]
MAINLGGMNLNSAQGVDVTTQQPGVTLNLQKNQLLDLTKREPGLNSVTLGAGWDVSNTGQGFDLDIAAFLLDANGKFNTIDNVIFFNNKVGQGIQMSGDNVTGAGEGDDERINIELNEISPMIKKIVFVVTIHNAMEKRQTFGMVNNAYVRILNRQQGDKEICRFDLRENSSAATSVIFAELNHEVTGWQFKAIGDGKVADLNGILALYQ